LKDRQHNGQKKKMAKRYLDKNKGKLLFENLKKQVSIIVKCLINKTHGNLQHPIFLNK
jgi:hypothetical protein